MVSSTVAVFVSLLLVQTSYAQCLGNLNNIQPNNFGAGQLARSSIGNFGQNSFINQNQNSMLSQSGFSLNNQGNTLSIMSSSPAYADFPSGVSINSDNIELGGSVAVNGALPFLGSVSLDGNVPNVGDASLSYSAGPGVSLSGGGCNQGFSGSVTPRALGSLANSAGGSRVIAKPVLSADISSCKSRK